METPPSIKTKEIEEGERKFKKSRQIIGEKRKDQRAFLDITNNDSPIVGLAEAKFLKISESKKRGSCKIQGSGESLLRGQVKTLLDKVGENTEIPNLFDNQVKKLGYVTPCLFENKIDISQMGSGIFGEKKDYVTRSLIYDFMEI